MDLFVLVIDMPDEVGEESVVVHLTLVTCSQQVQGLKSVANASATCATAKQTCATAKQTLHCAFRR